MTMTTSLRYFYVALASWGGVFVVLMSVHAVLSRRKANRVIYYPKPLISGRKLPDDLESSWRPWGWIVAAARTKESDLVTIAGLDAAIYLQLYNTALADENLKIMKRNRTYDFNYTKLDELAVSNVQPKSSRSWAYLGAMYWVSFVTYWTLNRTYKHVVKLRTKAQTDVKPMPEQFACLVRDIPKLKKSEPATSTRRVENFFSKTHPDTYEKSLIVSRLNKPLKLWTELETTKTKLMRAEAVHKLSKTKTSPEGNRPQHRTGRFGVSGPKVDSIEHWNKKIKDLTPVLREEQTRTTTDEQRGAAVIFFNSRRGAAEASQEKHSPYADRWQVLPAPQPRAVIWENMHVRFYSRLVREWIVYVVVFLLLLLYMIPIAFIAALTTLNTITDTVTFLKSIVNNPGAMTVIPAFLPQLALNTILYFLPYPLVYLSKQEGIVSKAHLDRAACGKAYYFIVFNITIGCTILVTFFHSANSLRRVIDARLWTFVKMIDLFGSSLPHIGTYFTLYIVTRFCYSFPLEMSRLFSLVYYYAKKKYLCKTEAEVMSAWAPGPIQYISNIPYDLLVMTITLTYAILTPLILPFAFVYFAIGWFVRRNQALRVYVADYESGGRFWPFIHNRFLVGLFVSQMTAFAYFGIKRFKFVFFLIPLPFITLFFASITHKVYYPSFEYIPVATASEEVAEVPTLHSLVDSFTPPCLLSPSATTTQNGKIGNSKYEDGESQLPSSTSTVVAFPGSGS